MRQDYPLYNEATGFTIHSHDLGGRTRQQVAESMEQSFSEGRILPLSLISDNSLRVRVVVGEDLSDQERDEWVGRVSWWLDLSDGQLVLEGGFDDRKANEELDFIEIATVEPGRYLVDVYAYLNGPNGETCIGAAGLDGSPLDWFRRAHPDRPVPGWFAERFEDWWPDDEELPEDDGDTRLVDYVVHLRPLDGDPPGEAPALTRGWLPHAVGARVPATCPAGLVAEPAPAIGEV